MYAVRNHSLAILLGLLFSTGLLAGPITAAVDQVGWETHARMVWNPTLDVPEVLYDVIRSGFPGDFTTAVCVKADEASIELTDPEEPLPGELFSYLVRPQSGGVEGSLGQDSGGSPRLGISCEGQPTPRGVELYQSTGSSTLELPPDFFGPGSDPFIGTVFFNGVPLDARGAFEHGSTDLVIDRHDPFSPVISPPRPTPVDIEIVELSLTSTAPIVVTFDGSPTQWDVFVTLEPEQPLGQMTMIPTGPDQGSFDLLLPINPVFRFEQVLGTGLVFDTPGIISLEGFGGNWIPRPLCSSAPLATATFDPGFCLSIGLSSPLLSLNLVPPVPTPLLPPPLIHPSATVDPSARIGRGAQIQAGATVQAEAVVGPGAIVDVGALVGTTAVIGADATIGPNAQVLSGAVVDDQTQIGPFSVIGELAVIGRQVIIADQVQIGQRVRIGGQSQVGQLAVVGDDVIAVQQVQIGDNAQVQPGLFLAESAIVLPGTLLFEDLVGCEPLFGGPIFVETALNCVAADGLVLHDVPQPFGPSLISVPGVKATPGDNNALPAGIGDLGDDIDDACIHRDKPGQAYVPTTHDCDDFADELEQALTAAGYDATFTCFRVYGPNPNHHWWNWLWTPDTITVKHHCNTDIHADGKIFWVEPQLSSANGAFSACTDMDFDNDGKVTYATKPGTKPTDGNARIEVYDNRAAAEAAGKVLD